VIATIPVGIHPYGIAFNPNNRDMYVTIHPANSGAVVVIDTSKNQVVGGTAAALGPIDLAFNPKNGNMYVTRDGGDSGIGGSVLLTDRSSNKPIGDITVGEFPIRIAYDPANGNMYVSNRDSNSVTAISTTSSPQDTTPPSITVPNSIGAEATSSSGAIVSYQATATDNVDGAITPVCNPPPGSAFSLGDNTVTCTATDKAGNTAKATFTVTVKDTTPPDTAITAAVDGNNKAVSNAGSTLYHSVQITFGGSDIVGIAGFQCSLDRQTASSCNSPVTFNNLAVGTHTFEVSNRHFKECRSNTSSL
jgi:DNA-binding beta-propeller fold protein YncE